MLVFLSILKLTAYMRAAVSEVYENLSTKMCTCCDVTMEVAAFVRSVIIIVVVVAQIVNRVRLQ